MWPIAVRRGKPCGRYATRQTAIPVAILFPSVRYWKGHCMRTIIRKRAVRGRVGYSDTQIWRLEKAGQFHSGSSWTEGGAVGWYEDEIDAWVDSRVRAAGKRPPIAGYRIMGRRYSRRELEELADASFEVLEDEESSGTEITVFGKDGGPLTKAMSLSDDGTLCSDASKCKMSAGEARRFQFEGMAQLADYINGLKPNEAISLGALRQGLPDKVRVVAKSRLKDQH